jgi:hypothetical protein
MPVLLAQMGGAGSKGQPDGFALSVLPELFAKAGTLEGFGPVETSAVHDRMPVILDPDAYELWLDPGMTNVAAASELLKPYDARLMRCYPV